MKAKWATLGLRASLYSNTCWPGHPYHKYLCAGWTLNIIDVKLWTLAVLHAKYIIHGIVMKSQTGEIMPTQLRENFFNFFIHGCGHSL